MKAHVYEFTGLDGVKGGQRQGLIVHSVTAADKALRKYKLASSAGDYGALNIWIDDDGAFRCERMRHMATCDSQVYGTKKQALRWFKINYRKCREG